MSTLYLSSDPQILAGRLADHLAQSFRSDDFFKPTTIVVPNRFVAKWLRLWLARKLGVAINLRFLRLEQAIWYMLQDVDPRETDVPLELVDHDLYRLMVLSVLIEEQSDELSPLRSYIQRGDEELGRANWRRSWHLADRVAKLIRDYEYHRQESLIQPWLCSELGLGENDDSVVRLEKSQREVFRHIIDEQDGRRAVLGRAVGKTYKTLPQYAQEIMELPLSAGSDKALSPENIHMFGVTQVSPLHIKTIRWLGSKLDLKLYHLNPLADRFQLQSGDDDRERMRRLADSYRSIDRGVPSAASPEDDVLRLWVRAGAESLHLVAGLANARSWHVEDLSVRITVADDAAGSLLQNVQSQLRGQPTSGRVKQDRSFQIVACPGAYREVETVYNSILHNLQSDPTLKQTDIAVLAADMERYRPVLQAVFDRRPQHLLYNLADYSAAGLSTFGQALVGMLDLALESFTRSRVFSVLLNPCFLARLRVDRSDALTRLRWAEALGVYHGWDQHDKQQRGYGSSPLFAWRLALRRLRLGRLMEVSDESTHQRANRFQEIVPYADLESSDKEKLNAFCLAVEGLLPTLLRLRRFCGDGTAWAEQIMQLVQSCLDVPQDRPEETQVRDQLLGSLSRLTAFDQMSKRSSDTKLPLPLIREFVVESLEELEGSRGDYLTGGVTISALQPFRPVPLRIVYLVGLGEGLFPGSDSLPAFDLRAQIRMPGDIRSAEFNRFLFLEVLLAACDKAYLLYCNKELQKDQELHPSVPVTQLRRFLDDHVLEEPFQVAEVPLSRADPRYLTEAEKQPFTDVWVSYNRLDRVVAIEEGEARESLTLSDECRTKFLRHRSDTRKQFEVPTEEKRLHHTDVDVPTVTITELKNFILSPAAASLKRHLWISDEESSELEDDEPFLTNALVEAIVSRSVFEYFVKQAVETSLKEATRAWPDRFAELFEDTRLRCRAPEKAFAQVHRQAMRAELDRRIRGPEGLAPFLRRRRKFEFCGPILIGESFSPIDARMRFPALKLNLGGLERPLYLPAEARLVGSIPLAWRSERSFEILVFSNQTSPKITDRQLCRPMLESVLTMIALKAGTETGDSGVSSSDWLKKLRLSVHVAHKDGIATFRYSARDFGRNHAYDYLRDLVGDLLDPNVLDLLPFEVIVKKKLLQAYSFTREQIEHYAHDYRERLDAEVHAHWENDFTNHRRSELLNVVDPQVPKDAFQKVRWRYRLLDRGPARNRKKDKGADGDGNQPQQAHSH